MERLDIPAELAASLDDIRSRLHDADLLDQGPATAHWTEQQSVGAGGDVHVADGSVAEIDGDQLNLFDECDLDVGVDVGLFRVTFTTDDVVVEQYSLDDLVEHLKAGVASAADGETFTLVYPGEYTFERKSVAEDGAEGEPFPYDWSEELDTFWASLVASGANPLVVRVDASQTPVRIATDCETPGVVGVDHDPGLRAFAEEAVAGRQARADFAADRTATYESWGKLDDLVLTPLLSGIFSGGPQWPGGREAFRVIHREHSTLLVTEGLADDYEDDDEATPIRLEIVVDLPGTFEVSQVQQMLGFDAISQLASAMLEYEDVTDLLDERGHLTMDIPAPEGTPEELLDDDDCYPAMIGLSTEGVPSVVQWGGSDVRLVTLVVLSQADGEAMNESDDEREATIARLAADPRAAALNATQVG